MHFFKSNCYRLLSLPIISFTLSNAILTPGEARPPTCKAKDRDSKVADFGKKAMPIGALAISLVKMDWIGAILSQVLAEGLYTGNRGLEKKINKKRPCGCNGAFPSGHMIMYASSASYLHYRYGWQYGFPAYLIALGFSYDRVKNKAHSWGDMLGTAAIVNVITFIVTPRYTPDVEYLPSFTFTSTESPVPFVKKKKSPPDFMSRIIPIVQANKHSYILGFVIKL